MISDGVVGRGDFDDDVIPDFTNLSNYCSHKDANVSLNASQERDLSVLYINIVSLSSNMTLFLNLLTKFNKKPDEWYYENR